MILLYVTLLTTSKQYPPNLLTVSLDSLGTTAAYAVKRAARRRARRVCGCMLKDMSAEESEICYLRGEVGVSEYVEEV
jgi:hypothetical protein